MMCLHVLFGQRAHSRTLAALLLGTVLRRSVSPGLMGNDEPLGTFATGWLSARMKVPFVDVSHTV